MILAAGRGERMGSLTSDCPKPLLEVGGEPLIVRHLRRLAASGIREVIVNLSYLGERIRERLGDGSRWQLRIRYSEEGEPPLETAGGIVAALPLLGGEPFVLVNADVVTDFDFARLNELRGRGVLVLVPNPPHHPRGDFGFGAGGLLSGREPFSTFAGISLLDPALFAGLAPGARKLKPILDAAITERSLHGMRHAGLWLDVGTPERLAVAERALAGSA